MFIQVNQVLFSSEILYKLWYLFSKLSNAKKILREIKLPKLNPESHGWGLRQKISSKVEFPNKNYKNQWKNSNSVSILIEGGLLKQRILKSRTPDNLRYWDHNKGDIPAFLKVPFHFIHIFDIECKNNFVKNSSFN